MNYKYSISYDQRRVATIPFNSLSTGVIILQGPHRVAGKSTNTGLLPRINCPNDVCSFMVYRF